MELKNVFIVFLFLMLAECSRIVSRHRAGSLKKESNLKIKKRAVVRDVVFENLFQVYDPSFLAVVWPKISNGVHLLLDVSCWEDISLFFKGLSASRLWAYRAVDASGRYQSALFNGNRFWLGSKEQCLLLDDEYTARSNVTHLYKTSYTKSALRREKFHDEVTHGWQRNVQYNKLMQQVAISDRPPYRLAYSTVQVALNFTKTAIAKSYDIVLGVCLPRSCAVNDIKSIINFSIMINDNLKSNRTLPRTARVVTLRKLESYDFKNDIGALFLISVTFVLVMLGIVATAVEIELLKCPPFNKRSMSFDLEKYNTTNDRSVDKETKVINEGRSVGDEKRIADFGISNSTSSSLVPAKKTNAITPTTKPDLVSEEIMIGSCKRCNKYKNQCSNVRQIDNLPACPRIKYDSAACFTTQGKRNSLFCSLFLCFSLIYSWKRIFNKNMANKDLFLIHALKIIATFWIIFIHVAVMIDYISDDADDINQRNNTYYILVTGTIAFDTLFFVSGLFSSHHFFYLKSRYSVKELVTFRGSCSQILQFVCFVTNRVIRMVPPYAYAILVTAVLARVHRNIAVLTLRDGDHHNCDAYWWRNIVYMSNIYPNVEQCMQVSWYLSTETQLHAAGALACAASVSAQKFANTRGMLVASLALVILFAATAIDVSTSYIDNGLFFTNAYNVYWVIIARPWARLAPYFIGVFAGWLVHVKQGSLKVTTATASLLWVASVSVLVVSVLLPWLGQVWLGAWLHLLWPVGLLWPMLVCATSHIGVWGRASAALSRLCYGMLLVHAAVAKALLLGADAAVCSQTICIWSYFAGTSLLTVLASLLLSLLVEMPCCSLLRRISDYATA